jgi:outer membrane protein
MKELIMKRSLTVLTSVILSVALAVPAFAHEAGQWILRAGVGTVMPKDDNLSLPEITIGPNTINAATVQVDDGTSLTLTGTYMFTNNWALDILAAYPFKHDVDLSDVTLNGGAVPGTVPFGEVEHLPPTVSVQYHFMPDATFQPFVGLGLNYTTFLSEDLNQDIIDLGIVDFSLDDSFGVAAQIGADWVFGENWLLNFDIRWIDIEADLTATVDDGVNPPVTGKLGTVSIDPWVFAINLGYAF